MKKYLFIIIFLFYGCGYTSIYTDKKNQNIRINIVNMEGDKTTNNFIKNQLKLASYSNSPNIYDLSYITTYNKIVISKNSTGLATNYKLSINVEFTILSDENKKIEFKETFNIKNISEKFEQLNYEKEIKKNFAISIKDKLIFNLLVNNAS